jgi:hypothetical protein
MIRDAIYLTEAYKGLEKYALRLDENLTYLYNADDEFREKIYSYDTEEMEGKILLAFGIKEEMYIDAIWAQKGFGPLAYMLAMKASPSGWLAPNWNRSQITKSAQKVWKEFFDGKGSDLVEKELIHPAMEPDNMFNYKFRLKKSLNTTKNEKLHAKFIGDDKYGEIRGMIDELAEGNLRHSMRGIYT